MSKFQTGKGAQESTLSNNEENNIPRKVLVALLHIGSPLHWRHGSDGRGQTDDHRGIFTRPHISLSTECIPKSKIQYPCQVFSTSVPALVTTSFATVYLMSMAAGEFHVDALKPVSNKDLCFLLNQISLKEFLT